MSIVVIDKSRFAEELLSKKDKYYRIAYSYARNEQDALDIVGDATCKGLKNLRTLREPSYFDTWMTRIVINTAIDFTRKSFRVSSWDITALDQIAITKKSLTPEDHLDLYQALNALDEKHRVCVTLRYFEGYSFARIAVILQQPETTIRSRLYRALRKMRKYLENG